MKLIRAAWTAPLLGVALMAATAMPANAAPCRDSHGKFVACAAKPAKSAKATTAKATTAKATTAKATTVKPVKTAAAAKPAKATRMAKAQKAAPKATTGKPAAVHHG